MKQLSVEYVASSVGGEVVRGDFAGKVKGVSIDSRKIKSGELFFAIIGERLDGHDFIGEAVENGAAAIIVDREVKAADEVTVIRVKDTTRALQDLAANYRLLLKDLKVVAITGSAGKTSTKDMMASVLKIKYKTKKTSGNLNNYYGLPLTILDFDGDEEIAVLEMGMSELGEIKLLCDIARPHIGVITNVGKTHLETLGSIENVARGKSELIAALPEDGMAILNYDNKYVRNMENVFKGKQIIYYGLSSEADIYADEIRSDSSNGVKYKLHFREEMIEMSMDRPGRHNVYNSLAAIAVARSLGLSWQNIRDGFTRIEYSALRWDVKKTKKGITIVDDTYNANPLSMRAVIEAVSSIKGERTIAVLGAMLELGKEEEKAHLELGEFLSKKGLDLLLSVGKTASLIADGAENEGMDKNRVKRVKDNYDAVSFLDNYLKSGDILLVKGSRGNKMEKIVEELMD